MIAVPRDLPTWEELEEAQSELSRVIQNYGLSDKDTERLLRYVRDHFREWRAAKEASDFLDRQVRKGR